MSDPILYRWWDADGRLLYVGKSVSLFGRIVAHRRDSGFFADAAAMTLERFATPEALGAAEVAAIRNEGPLFNIAHSVRRGGDEARTITIFDGPPPVLDTRIAHWAPVEAEDMACGDIIRGVYLTGEIDLIGIIDDDASGFEFEDAEDDETGWYLLTDEGTEAVLWRSEVPFYDLYRWVCAGDDPLRGNILDAWYSQLPGGMQEVA